MKKLTFKLAFFFFSAISADAKSIFKTDTCDIPTIITPNEDGRNDILTIPCVNLDKNESELLIFTEWGERIANFKPYLNNWSGTYNTTNPLPDGTYFYVFRLNNSSQPQKGFVTILR